MPLVELADVRAGFGPVEVLHGVDLTLDAGEIYGLLGPNGAGKSTTMAVIAGLLPATSGRISVLGQDPLLDGNAVHARCGMLPEQSGFYDWMTATEYLGWFGRLYDDALDEDNLEARLAQVGLAPRPGQRIGTFSRGMKQRLGLARALINAPELLLLDEPTNGLDPRGRREIHDILLAGILICTHLLDDVDRLCRRIGILRDGKTVLEGTVADLLAPRGAARFRLRLHREPPAAAWPAFLHPVAYEDQWYVLDLDPTVAPSTAWRQLLADGWAIDEVRYAGGGLEALYMSATEAPMA